MATLQEVGLELSPDIVIYNLCLNDSDPVHYATLQGLFLNAEISTLADINLRTIVGSSYLLTFIKFQVINLLSKTKPELITAMNNPQLTINKRVGEVAWSTMKAEIQKIRDVAVNGNAQFLVAV